MPRRTNRTVARKPRQGTVGRKARHAALRPRKQPAPPVPAIAGTSLASLKLESLAVADVFCRIVGIDSPEKPEKMFRDLAASYMAAITNWQGAGWEMMPWSLYGKTVGHAIHFLMEDFGQRFGRKEDGLSYMVSERDGIYFFTLYRAYDSPEEWLAFETRKLLASVKKASKPLYQLTLSFLAAFIDRCGIPTWFNGGMEYAEEWVEEQIAQQEMEGYGDYENAKEAEDDFAKAKRDLSSFRVGAAAACAIDIRRAHKAGPDEILKALARIRVAHPIKEAITAGCALMVLPYTLNDFCHYNKVRDGEGYNEDVEGLPFYDQFLMLWEYDNALTSQWEEWINNRANESGTMPPVMSYEVRLDREDWSREHFDNGKEWVGGLVNVFRLLSDAALPPKTTNKNPDEPDNRRP